jgi:hypothetical protein
MLSDQRLYQNHLRRPDRGFQVPLGNPLKLTLEGVNFI